MKRYTKEIDGKTVIKERKNIVLRRNGKQIINPSEEMIFAEGWEEYIPPTYERTIEDYRRDKKEEITRFDSSHEVNEFRINGMSVWIDKATRAGLMLRFQAEKAIGKTDTSLWYEGYKFDLTIDAAMQMLYALEVYASTCYDNTQLHLSVIGNLETIEEIEAYDYRTGYPEKLEF